MLQFLDELVDHRVVNLNAFNELFVCLLDIAFLHQKLGSLLRLHPLLFALLLCLRFHLQLGSVKYKDGLDTVGLKHSHLLHAVIYQLFNALVG